MLYKNLRWKVAIVTMIFMAMFGVSIVVAQDASPAPLENLDVLTSPIFPQINSFTVNGTSSTNPNPRLLRLDSPLTIAWNVEMADSIQLQVTENGQLVQEIPLEAVGSLSYSELSNFLPGEGRWSILLIASRVTDEGIPAQINAIQDILALPLNVEQAWIDAISVIAVCYVEGGSGAPVQWQLTNNNTNPINNTPLVQIQYDWLARNVVGEILQSAENQTNPGIVTLNTVDAYTIQVRTYLVINNGEFRYSIGESGALSRDDFSCTQ